MTHAPNPYQSPDTTTTAGLKSSTPWLWFWCACSLAASSLSLVLWYMYGQWHWHKGPWEETLPGSLGLSWIMAVDGSKACSVLLAIFSLCVTVAIFRKGRRLQGWLTLPTCVLSLLTVGYVT